MNGTADPPAQIDLWWKQYAINVDLYKFYLDLAVKINVFYYAITGAIVAYYFQHANDGITRYALILPILFSFAFGAVSLYGAKLLGVTREEMFAIRDKLKFEAAPEFMVLIVFLRVLGGIQLGVGVALGTYFGLLFR